MKKTLLDTDILSYYLKGNPQVVARVEAYLAQYGKIHFSEITVYEILSGMKHRDIVKMQVRFREMLKEYGALKLTKASIEISSTLCAEQLKCGLPKGRNDILIAGIAVARGMCLATNNTKDYAHIEGLEIVNWTEEK